MAELQQATFQNIKELQHESKSAKHNKAKTIEAFQNKSFAFARPSHFELAKIYNAQLDLLQAIQYRKREWTMTNMQGNANAIGIIEHRLRETADQVDGAIRDIQQAIKRKNDDEAAKRIRHTTERDSIVKLYKQCG